MSSTLLLEGIVAGIISFGLVGGYIYFRQKDEGEKDFEEAFIQNHETDNSLILYKVFLTNKYG